MAQLQDIPRLTGEFIELARAYLLQETVEPAKRLGHFAGYSLGAAALWAIAFVLISVAGLRSFYDVLPEGPYWESLAYIVTAIVLVLFMALLVRLVPDRGVHDGPPIPEDEGDLT